MPGMSERRFQLVLVAQLFTHSLPARIQMVDTAQTKIFLFCLHAIAFFKQLLDTLAVKQ